MQIDFTFRNLESSNEVKEYVEAKIGRVKRYLLEPIEAHVVLKAEKYRHIAEITIKSNGIRINASEETEDLYSAIDLLADTVEAQIKKQLDKMRRKKLSPQERSILKNRIPPTAAQSAENPESGDEYIIYTERYNPKPIDIDEAILQLNRLGNDFLVFTNQETGKINVIYRRKDGNYGLIET